MCLLSIRDELLYYLSIFEGTVGSTIELNFEANIFKSLPAQSILRKEKQRFFF
jgi:hypothetical protein